MSSAILVKDMMSVNVKTGKPDSKLKEIIQKMVKFNISSVVILDRERPVGIITERDLLKQLVNPSFNLEIMEAKDIMSSPLFSIDEDADIDQASKMMLDHNVKKLPVVKNGRLIGIITSSDIIRGTKVLTGTLKDICSIGRMYNNK
jgi:CBS domain-containing protein